MDIELRLATLSNLVSNKSEAVFQRLSDEFGRVDKTLSNGADYEELSDALQILAALAPRFHGSVIPILTDFVRSVPVRILTHDGEPIATISSRYKSASHLIREAIDTAATVNFVHTEAAVDFFLELSRSSDDEIRGQAVQALEKLTKYNLDIFYNGDQGIGIGGQVQLNIVAHLSKLEAAQLMANAGVILGLLRNMLSPTIQGSSWTYSSVTIRRGAVNSAGGVAEVRRLAIALLQRMYALSENVGFRKNVISSLNEAMRREQPASDAETASMFERDALEVLKFLRSLVSSEALPIVQAIEHQAYWNFYHAATPSIRESALAVRDLLDQHAEYQIYKQLIGFEGIFGQWEQLRRSDSAWHDTDIMRRAAAHRFVAEIDDTNRSVWRDRILLFSKTQSDDLATFPVYYEFLETLGRESPSLAFDLVTDHIEAMERFLIPLVSGLWMSAMQTEIRTVVELWLLAGKHLSVIAKSLYKDGARRLGTLSEVVAISADLDNRAALINSMAVATSLYGQGCVEAKDVFVHALRVLVKRGDARWVEEVWFNKDFLALVDALDMSELNEMLANVMTLPKLNYHAEEILYAIGKRNAQAVLDSLMERIRTEGFQQAQTDDPGVRLESIPYHLEKLPKLLSQIPHALLTALRRDFKDTDTVSFPYRGGGRLIKAVFPEFETQLETFLLKSVEDGTQEDIDFALAIMRVYEGSPVILPMCRAIIKVVPEASEVWNEVAAAIETTGVVSGEYGMAQAFEKKRDQISAWLSDEHPLIRSFAEWLTDALKDSATQFRKRADEDIALRKYKYGVNKDQA